jgi:hypothetical protein
VSPTRAACAVFGFGAIAAALAIGDGHGGHVPLLLVIVAVAAWSAAATLRWCPLGWRATATLAWALALAFCVLDLAMDPGIYLRPDAPRWPLLASESLAIVLVATYGPEVWRARPPPPAFAWVRRALLASIALGLGAWMLRASPEPRIDVWAVHQQGAEALLRGRSIYASGVVETVDTNTMARSIDAYAYPPLNAILTAAAYALTGETRWAALVAQVAGATLLWSLARRPSPRGEAWADLLAVLLLFFPRGLFVLEQAWGEPLALPLLAGFALAHARRKDALAAVLLGLLFALKQYFVLFAPLLLSLPGDRGRRALVAAAVAASTVLPFALLEPAGVWRNLVAHHVANPFRPDSLSLPAALSTAGIRVPSWVGLAAAALPYALLPRVGRGTAELALVACLSLLGFFVLGRQAFCNYYYLVCGAALVALAAGGPAVRADAGAGAAADGAADKPRSRGLRSLRRP